MGPVVTNVDSSLGQFLLVWLPDLHSVSLKNQLVIPYKPSHPSGLCKFFYKGTSFKFKSFSPMNFMNFQFIVHFLSIEISEILELSSVFKKMR